MADTPREKTRNNWWLLIAVAVAALAAVVWWSATRRGEDIGGTIAMESADPPAERPQTVPNP